MNTFRKVGKQQRCYTVAKTKVVVQSLDPIFNQAIRIACVGHAGFVVFNVMSKHTLAEDSIIGQAVINLENHKELYEGSVHNLRLPLQTIKHDVHDSTGSRLNLSPPSEVTGTLKVSINIPSIYQNMCGWFWSIKEGFLQGPSGEKQWVVLHDGRVYVYSNPYDLSLIMEIDVDDIQGIKETTYDKLEINVEGLKIWVKPSEKTKGIKREKELLWAWGDDSSKTKGLWRRALIQHDCPSNIAYNDPDFKLGSPKASSVSSPTNAAKVKNVPIITAKNIKRNEKKK